MHCKKSILKTVSLMALCFGFQAAASSQEIWVQASGGALGVAIPSTSEFGWIAPGGSLSVQAREMGKARILAGIGGNYNYLLEQVSYIQYVQFVQAVGIIGFTLPLGAAFTMSPSIGCGVGFMMVNWAPTDADYAAKHYVVDLTVQTAVTASVAFRMNVTDYLGLSLIPEYRFLAEPDKLNMGVSVQLACDYKLWTPGKSGQQAKKPSEEKKPAAKETATPAPTATPAVQASAKPSAKPTVTPSAKPTVKPSAKPTVKPSAKPTIAPAIAATPAPTPVASAKAVPSAAPMKSAAPAAASAAASADKNAPAGAFAPLSAYPNVKVSQKGKAVRITMEAIFESSSSVLGSAIRTQLTTLGGILKGLSIADLSIEGFAVDDKGLEAKRDVALSTERAESVRSFLAKAGYFSALADAPKAIGRGMEAPVAGNDTLEGRKRNRRVEIVINLK